MQKQLVVRQGDVLLIAVSEIPSGAKDITPTDRIVLAYGEATGHAHAIENAPVKARLWDAGAERFLQVIETTALRHEEHREIPLAPGNYLVLRQVEYTPKELRPVAD